MLEKQDIVEAIRAATQENGSPPGRVTFETLTGIRRHEWYGRYWANWGQALQEAGFSPNSRTLAADREKLLAAYLDLIVELGHVPTEGELRVKTRNSTDLPSHSTFRTALGRKNELLKRVLAFAVEKQADPETLSIIKASIAPQDERFVVAPTAKESKDGFVYLIKSGKNFKIGRTNAIDRRQFEIGMQLPEKIEPLHAIRTDDPSGIEAYWHNRFRDKRLNGEWFRLSSEDVRTFKRRKFM